MADLSVPVSASITFSPGRATLAALLANFVGVGLARFAYTPLIPALISGGWFSPSEAAYLGAANLAGYLLGALGARGLAFRFGAAPILRALMLLTAASLLACAWPRGFAWFFGWRLVSGCTGGALMALAAPIVLSALPAGQRGLAGGVIFTGVGLGIAASATLVPLLLRFGLATAWIGLAVVALAMTVIAWGGWPSFTQLAAPKKDARSGPRIRSGALPALYVEYALCAIGLVPHMVFLVDFVARGLGRGTEAGAICWALFGIGALTAPVIGGYAGDRIGFRRTLRFAFLVEIGAISGPLLTTSPIALGISSVLVGGFVSGVVAIVIGRTRELIPNDAAAQARAWSYCTTAFACGQAVAGYGYSWLFARTGGGYLALFAIGAVAVALALMVDIAAGFIWPARSHR